MGASLPRGSQTNVLTSGFQRKEQRTSSWADGEHIEERTIWEDGGVWKDLRQARIKE